MACANCKGTGLVAMWGEDVAIRPCPCCSDSGTPDLDYIVGRRYAAGIDLDGKLVVPISQCLNKDGTVKVTRGWGF
jgi:hypothetical protein